MPKVENEPTTKEKQWQPNAKQTACLLGFSKNSQYYIQNLEDIKEKYSGQFIAILDNAVVENQLDGRKIVALIKQKFGEQKCSSIFITYVPTGQEVRVA